MRDWIKLDNGSTVDLYCNLNLNNNIRTIPESLELKTNGGVLFTYQCADVPRFGRVWLNESAMIYIFSLAKLVRKNKVIYNSTKTPAFLVFLPEKIVRFECTPVGLFILTQDYDTTKHQPFQKVNFIEHSIDSVEANCSLLTDRQYHRAKYARQVYHALGTPSLHF
jgi:hypothetical protein